MVVAARPAIVAPAAQLAQTGGAAGALRAQFYYFSTSTLKKPVAAFGRCWWVFSLSLFARLPTELVSLFAWFPTEAVRLFAPTARLTL